MCVLIQYRYAITTCIPAFTQNILYRARLVKWKILVVPLKLQKARFTGLALYTSRIYIYIPILKYIFYATIMASVLKRVYCTYMMCMNII